VGRRRRRRCSLTLSAGGAALVPTSCCGRLMPALQARPAALLPCCGPAAGPGAGLGGCHVATRPRQCSRAPALHHRWPQAARSCPGYRAGCPPPGPPPAAARSTKAARKQAFTGAPHRPVAARRQSPATSIRVAQVLAASPRDGAPGTRAAFMRAHACLPACLAAALPLSPPGPQAPSPSKVRERRCGPPKAVAAPAAPPHSSAAGHAGAPAARRPPARRPPAPTRRRWSTWTTPTWTLTRTMRTTWRTWRGGARRAPVSHPCRRCCCRRCRRCCCRRCCCTAAALLRRPRRRRPRPGRRRAAQTPDPLPSLRRCRRGGLRGGAQLRGRQRLGGGQRGGGGGAGAAGRQGRAVGRARAAARRRSAPAGRRQGGGGQGAGAAARQQAAARRGGGVRGGAPGRTAAALGWAAGFGGGGSCGPQLPALRFGGGTAGARYTPRARASPISLPLHPPRRSYPALVRPRADADAAPRPTPSSLPPHSAT
jgi:hypothetical protein